MSCNSVRHWVCACNLYLFDARGLEEEDVLLSEQGLAGACLVDPMHSVVLCKLHSDCYMNGDGSCPHCIQTTNNCS